MLCEAAVVPRLWIRVSANATDCENYLSAYEAGRLQPVRGSLRIICPHASRWGQTLSAGQCWPASEVPTLTFELAAALPLGRDSLVLIRKGKRTCMPPQALTHHTSLPVLYALIIHWVEMPAARTTKFPALPFAFVWRIPGFSFCLAFLSPPHLKMPSLVAQTVKNLPMKRETWVPSLGQKDPLGKGTATHSSILALRISWTEEPGGLPSMVSQRVGHAWVSNAQHS